MSDAVFTLHRGDAPLLVSLPHVGTRIPDDQQPRYVERAMAVEDTDWHLERVYGFAREMGASLIVPRMSRYVIDLNRPPENTPMYPGANNTELCPTRFFTGDPLYRDGLEPDAAEVERRVQRYWRPYHDALANELSRLKAQHGHAVLFDGHSIKSELPWLFEGRLPDLNLGCAAGQSCAPSLRDALAAMLRGAERLHSRRRRPLQGRLHHAPLRLPARRRSCRAARDVLALHHGGAAAIRIRRGARGTDCAAAACTHRHLPVLESRRCLNCVRPAIGRRARGCRKAGASTCCWKSAATDTGRR